jgi:hypothetical protein
LLYKFGVSSLSVSLPIPKTHTITESGHLTVLSPKIPFGDMKKT